MSGPDININDFNERRKDENKFSANLLLGVKKFYSITFRIG